MGSSKKGKDSQIETPRCGLHPELLSECAEVCFYVEVVTNCRSESPVVENTPSVQMQSIKENGGKWQELLLP